MATPSTGELPARVRVTAEVHPTEDPARVERAVRNLFPDAECRIREAKAADEHDRLEAEAGDLARLRDLVADQRIQDTARTQLLHGRGARRVTVELSKQAAFAGAVNFSVERAPLGDLLVEVEADPGAGGPADLEALVEAVAPASREHVPKAKHEAGEAGEGDGTGDGEPGGEDGDGDA